MNLSTKYLGLELPHPFVAGASPLADTLDGMRRLEDAGAALIVLRSLFEEQLDAEALATYESVESHAESSGEALSYFADPEDFALGPQEYLERLRQAKTALAIPVIASLNGARLGGWLQYAKAVEEAGADAVELNLYDVATDPAVDATALEGRAVEMVSEVKRATHLPLAVKISPFYTSLPHFAGRLQEAGADALVLFNRFFEPDVDTEHLEILPHLSLSDSSELLLRLRWLAILSGQLEMDFAVTGGVHNTEDAIKALMCGAGAVQIVSVLLQQGLDVFATLRQELDDWLEDNEYESLGQMRGSMNIQRCPDPRAFARANYMRALQTWVPD